VQAVRTVTDRPIRYLVDTHFHFDHAFGSAAFGADTIVIGHEATRSLLGPRRFAAGRIAASPTTSPPGRAAPCAGGVRALGGEAPDLAARAESLGAYARELATLTLVPPGSLFSERASVDLGRREVQLLFPGRGHTAGDVVVFLPRERILCTGDFFNGHIGYMGDAYVDEWADSLDRLARLDFETVIPGHGAPFTDKARIALVQACLRDLWRQAADLRRAGVPADAAAPRIDLRAHAAHFPPLGDPGFDPVAVRRIYEVLDERQAGR